MNARHRRRKANARAGCVSIVIDRKTQVERGTYRADEAELDVAPDRYAVMCEEHSTLVGAGSLRVAGKTSTLDFCEECVDAAERLETRRQWVLT